MWRVTEAPWRILQRSLCSSWAALSWFYGLVSSQYLISMRWMSHCRVLRSLGRCCLGRVDLLVAAGGATEVLPFSLSCPLPLLRTHPTSSLLLFCFSVGGSNQYSFWTAGGQTNFCLRGRVLDYTKEPLWYNPSFSCIGNLKILHSQPFAATYIHADEAGS